MIHPSNFKIILKLLMVLINNFNLYIYYNFSTYFLIEYIFIIVSIFVIYKYVINMIIGSVLFYLLVSYNN